MPKVGDKHFAYTAKGKAKAKAHAEAKKTGKKVEKAYSAGRSRKGCQEEDFEEEEGFVNCSRRLCRCREVAAQQVPQFTKVNTAEHWPSRWLRRWKTAINEYTQNTETTGSGTQIRYDH